MTDQKKVKLDLCSVDGNAFALLSAWREAAIKQGWDREAAKAVVVEAMQGDYSQLVATLQKHCDSGDDE